MTLGGKDSQAGQGAPEVLGAQLGKARRQRLLQGVDTNFVGHGTSHHLSSIEVEGVDGVRCRLVAL